MRARFLRFVAGLLAIALAGPSLAVTAIGTGTATTVTSVTTLTLALNIPNTGGNFAVACGLGVYGVAGRTVSTVTFGGASMTLVTTQGTINSDGLQNTYVLVNPTVGSSQNFSVTMSGSIDEALLVCQGFNNVHQTVPTATVTNPTLTSSGTTTTAHTTTVGASELQLAFLYAYAGANTTIAGGTGDTILAEDEAVGDQSMTAIASTTDNSLNFVMTPAMNTPVWQSSSFRLAHSAFGGGSTTPLRRRRSN